MSPVEKLEDWVFQQGRKPGLQGRVAQVLILGAFASFYIAGSMTMQTLCALHYVVRGGRKKT